MAFKRIPSNEFEYIDEAKWYSWSGFKRIFESLTAILGVPSVIAPVTPKPKPKPKPKQEQEQEHKQSTDPEAWLPVLGKGVGFDDTHEEQFSMHGKRVELRGAVLVLGLLTLFVLLFFPMTHLLSVLPGNSASLFALPALFLLFYLALGVVLKLGSIFLDRHFAESLCVMVAVYVLVELGRDNALSNPKLKKRLLLRLNDLARSTELLSLRYRIRDGDTQGWARKHFANMAYYIRQRVRWAIAPGVNTGDDLRRDFYHLCEIYVSGNYGTFTWVHMPTAPKIERATVGKRLVSSSLKFIGLSLPIVIMAGALLWPGELKSRGIDLSPNMLALILMAWILLTVDATLRLGVVANLVSLAKGIKGLK